MSGLRRSSNRRSASTSSRGNSERSGRRRWKWRAAAAKRSCVRRTPTRFGCGSRRFQRGNAWVAGLIARPRSISLRRGPGCSTAHNDRWTSCKSITRSSISSWSTMSNACRSGGRGSRWRSTYTAGWSRAFTSRSIRPERSRRGCASRMRHSPKKPGLQSWGSAGNGRAGDLRPEFISTTPRNSTARCCAGRASNTASCSNTGRWRNRTWVVISSGCWERSWARCMSYVVRRSRVRSNVAPTIPMQWP
jgi:hypothetical protein